MKCFRFSCSGVLTVGRSPLHYGRVVAPESRRVIQQQRDTSDGDVIEGERHQVLKVHAKLGRINDLKL